MNGNGHQSQAEKRAFAQLEQADAKLRAALHGVVYDPLPRRSHDWTGAIGLVLLVLAGLALWAAFQS